MTDGSRIGGQRDPLVMDYPARASVQGVEEGGEVGAFGVVVAELYGAGELEPGLVGLTDPGQQLAPDTRQAMAGELQPVQGTQPRQRSICLADGHRTVESDDRRVLEGDQ